jgi:hypothetical protein
LSDGASETELGDYLLEEVRDHFGLTPSEEGERALAADLKRWWAVATTPDV